MAQASVGNIQTSSEPKVALVTGGSSGIGEATVKLLLESGYKVALCASRKEKVDRVLAECTQLSPYKFQPLGMVLDLSEPTNGKVAVERTVEHFGRLDVLVNNAGAFMKTSGSDSMASYENYKRVMSINLDAAVCATLAAVEPLKRSGNGQVIFVSSTASVKPHENSFAYGASKAAMSMLAKCLAVDFAKLEPAIRVNTVSPGPVMSDIYKSVGVPPEVACLLMGPTTLSGRIGQPREVAEAVLYLLGAEFVSGHELFIDGGYLLKPNSMSANTQLKSHVKKD